MRTDFDKVIVERPRHGHSNKFHSARNRKEFVARRGEMGEARTKESMSIRHTTGSGRWGGGKQFNEHLRPLERYLHKQVNRPWNKVYGEICQQFDRRSALNDHILSHVEDYVEFTTPFEPDYNRMKMRVCEYVPLGEAKEELHSSLVSSKGSSQQLTNQSEADAHDQDDDDSEWDRDWET